MFWRTYKGTATGLLLKGDGTVPHTTWWNHLWLRATRWKEVTILSVPHEIVAYRVGYRAVNGHSMIRTRIMRAPAFAVRHGREDCHFFAVDLQGTELPLIIVRRLNIELIPERVTLV